MRQRRAFLRRGVWDSGLVGVGKPLPLLYTFFPTSFFALQTYTSYTKQELNIESETTDGGPHRADAPLPARIWEPPGTMEPRWRMMG